MNAQHVVWHHPARPSVSFKKLCAHPCTSLVGPTAQLYRDAEHKRGPVAADTAQASPGKVEQQAKSTPRETSRAHTPSRAAPSTPSHTRTHSQPQQTTPGASARAQRAEAAAAASPAAAARQSPGTWGAAPSRGRANRQNKSTGKAVSEPPKVSAPMGEPWQRNVHSDRAQAAVAQHRDVAARQHRLATHTEAVQVQAASPMQQQTAAAPAASPAKHQRQYSQPLSEGMRSNDVTDFSPLQSHASFTAVSNSNNAVPPFPHGGAPPPLSPSRVQPQQQGATQPPADSAEQDWSIGAGSPRGKSIRLLSQQQQNEPLSEKKKGWGPAAGAPKPLDEDLEGLPNPLMPRSPAKMPPAKAAIPTGDHHQFTLHDGICSMSAKSMASDLCIHEGRHAS